MTSWEDFRNCLSDYLETKFKNKLIQSEYLSIFPNNSTSIADQLLTDNWAFIGSPKTSFLWELQRKLKASIEISNFKFLAWYILP